MEQGIEREKLGATGFPLYRSAAPSVLATSGASPSSPEPTVGWSSSISSPFLLFSASHGGDGVPPWAGPPSRVSAHVPGKLEPKGTFWHLVMAGLKHHCYVLDDVLHDRHWVMSHCWYMAWVS